MNLFQMIYWLLMAYLECESHLIFLMENDFLDKNNLNSN